MAEVAEKLGKLCGEKCLGGGNNVEIVPFGCFATTRIERIVVAHPQRRGEGMGRCVRRCRAICGAQDEGGGRECEQDLVGGGVWHRRICVGKRGVGGEEW